MNTREVIIVLDIVKLQLLEYMYRKEDFLSNDVQQLANNVQYRMADPVDHLEMIMAQTRLQTAKELCKDILQIVRRWK